MQRHFRQTRGGVYLPDREIWQPRAPAIIGRGGEPVRASAYVGQDGPGVAPVSGTITFREANFVRANSGTFGTTAPQGSLILIQAFMSTFSQVIPGTASGFTAIDSATFVGGPGYGEKFAYQVAGVGGVAGTGTWTGAEIVAWWIATNARNTWILGTFGAAISISANCVYAACTPNGTEDWCVSFMTSGGGFTTPALTAGTGVTQRVLNNAANPQIGVFDSNGVATTWPGQTTAPGYTIWAGRAIPVRAGA
jgi:hypothetical protein